MTPIRFRIARATAWLVDHFSHAVVLAVVAFAIWWIVH
jgi:hypothetical protein